MTKTDEALYKTLDLAWHVLSNISGRLRSLSTADIDIVLGDDLLKMREALTEYRQHLRENSA